MTYLSKNFQRHEFACKCGCGFDTVDAELLFVLQDARDFFKRPITINSAARCPVWNAMVGGKPKSQHLFGKAADITIHRVLIKEIYEYFDDKYPDAFGIGLYPSFVHIDVRRGPKRWAG